jgi:type VI secretion system secreted protein VgrG
VRIAYEVRPGAHAIRDYDFRNPGFNLLGESSKAEAPEDRYEQFHYRPGGFLIEQGKGGSTPIADDQGAIRHDHPFGQGRAARGMEADRTGRRAVAFDTNTIDLWPNVVFSIDNHPHPELGGARLLVTEFTIDGAPGEEWSMAGQAVFADVQYRPPVVTPKPEVAGVQSATVVGPKGQEIHTDEFGRVRVQFPWDREGQNDDHSSCWMRVSQGWAGTGYGMIVIPRIGQEVLVGFLQGDPDQPVIVGRVYNATQQVPYKLPDNKTRSTWKSDSSPGGGGFNEIMFEDLKGQELVYVQAEKNRRKLVKNDETITVGHDLEKLVKNDEFERTVGNLRVWVGKDQDIIVNEVKRERVEGLSHLRVQGDRRTKVDQNVSVIVGKSRHEKVGKNHALEVGKQIHMKAGSGVVLEAVEDMTFRAPGGFVRIDSSGITIRGTVVRINSGGSPGSGNGSKTVEPDEAIEAVTDDVSKTLIGQ